MKGFNFSSNGRTLEVFLPAGLSSIFPAELRKLMNSGSSFDRVVKALAIFSFQTNQECLFLADLSRILGMRGDVIAQVIREEIPQRKSEVMSHLSEICCELVEMNKYVMDESEQQDYLSPDLPDQAYVFFYNRLISHIVEFQLEVEYSILNRDSEVRITANHLNSSEA